MNSLLALLALALFAMGCSDSTTATAVDAGRDIPRLTDGASPDTPAPPPDAMAPADVPTDSLVDAPSDLPSVMCRSDRDCSETGRVCNIATSLCVECNSATDCAGGRLCQHDQCVAIVPCTSSRTCPRQVCSITLGHCVDCTTDTECPVGQYCTPANDCHAQTCMPNALECVDTTRSRACDAHGSAWTETACASTEGCLSGHCAARLCVPGVASCAGTTDRRVCNPDGMAYTTSPCASTETCTGGTCLPRTCMPGAASCASPTMRTLCNPDGSGYTTTTCPAMQGCRSGSCTPWTCMPAAASCASASTRQVCDADGFGMTATACASTETCAGGACVARVCTPGAASCTTSTMRTVCNPDGMGYTTTTCPAMQGCQSGACTPWSCSPGGASCASASAVQVCGSDGFTVTMSTCTAPAHASLARCESGACTFTCDAGYMLSGSGCDMIPSMPITAPRPVAPVSVALMTSRRPTFRWALATGSDGARVQVCRDRACSVIEQIIDAVGSSGSPSTELAAGIHFWRLYGRSGSSTGTTPSVVWEFAVGARSAPVSAVAGLVLDFNGDRFADVMVGARDDFAHIYRGSASGIPTSTDITVGLAYSVAPAGDVNGDGFTDVAVGDRMSDNVTVYYGDAGGTASMSRVVSGGRGIEFGESVAGLGDIDGDGYSDFAVGCNRGAGGRVFVYRGGIAGPTLATTINGPDHVSFFGIRVGGPGDVNGDGYADLVFSSFTELSEYVYLGSATGLSSTPSALLTATGASNGYGQSVAGAGDVNGDGYADIIVGTEYIAGVGGRAFVFRGGASGPDPSPTVLLRPGSTDESFGNGVASAGDVNGDGYGDVIVGAPYEAGGAMGRVHVFLGGSAGLSVSPVVSLVPPVAGAFGTAVAGLGDVNGDGYGDVIVGAPGTHGGDGAAYVFNSSATGLPAAASTTILHSTLSGGFGWIVARQ